MQEAQASHVRLEQEVEAFLSAVKTDGVPQGNDDNNFYFTFIEMTQQHMSSRAAAIIFW